MTILLPGVDDDTNALLNALVEQLQARQSRNLLRAAYYEGKSITRMLGSVVPAQYRNFATVLGWSAKAVDLLAQRVNLDGFTWPDGDIDSLGSGAVWDENRFASESNAAITATLLHPPGFLVAIQGESGEPVAQVHARDALNASGIWNARARRLDAALTINARDVQGQPSELALYLPGRTIAAVLDGGKWLVTSDSEHGFGMPVEPLVYQPRPARPFGSSRLSRALMSIHDDAVRALIRLEGHMDVYSFPEFWILGADTSIFRNPDGTPKADWQVMLGRIKGIPDDEEAANPRAAVQQFTASDPAPHLAALNAYAKLFAREASLPDTSLAITDLANPTSAEAYDASQHELIATAEAARDDMASAFARIWRVALAIAGGLDAVPEQWRTIAPRFRNPRYLSRAAEADAGMKSLTAMPWLAETSVGLELLGLTDEQITRATAERRRAQGATVLNALAARVNAG